MKNKDPNLQRSQLLQGGDEVDERRLSERVSSRHTRNHIDFLPAGRRVASLATRTRLCAGADFLNRQRNFCEPLRWA